MNRTAFSRCHSLSCRTIACAAIVVLLVVAGSARAQFIESVATGADMAGGHVTVTFFGGPMATGTITAVGTTGTATFPGSFLFTVAGETSAADWTLTNLDAGAAARQITAVSIDLTGSKSLFDNDSLPSTPLSLGGVPGATFVSGPVIAGSGEVVPWTSASNLGDMFTAENVSWGGFLIPAILPGGTAVWHDDTDRTTVPEPIALFLVAVAAWACLATCRRKPTAPYHV
jgi:hypothetical protein